MRKPTRFARVYGRSFYLATLLSLLLVTPASASLISWGNSDGAQIGAGYTSARVLPPEGVVFSPSNTVQVVAGASHALALQKNGTVLAWGDSFSGGLGIGVEEPPFNQEQPVTIPNLTGVTALADAGIHPMALKSDCSVWVWGSDLFGQLGNGTTAHGQEVNVRPAWSPQPVPGLCAKRIWAGGANDVAERLDGSIVVWGEGPALCAGELLPESAVPIPVAIEPGTVKQVAIGGDSTLGGHAIYLKNDGTVWTCGDNQYGQAGLGYIARQTTEKILTPTQVPGLEHIVEVAAGPWHDLALTSEGAVYAWGADQEGEIGTGSVGVVENCGIGRHWSCAPSPVLVSLNPMKQIAAGEDSYGLLLNGELEGWGPNSKGGLGSLLDPTQWPERIPGLEHVTKLEAVSAGNFAFARSTIAEPVPAVSITAGPGSLTVSWRFSGECTEPWKLQIRPVTKPQSEYGAFNRTEGRSFTFTGLTSGQKYNVLLQGNGFGAHGIDGIPQ
jgi:alpha-tubulin suppressor-like RCC1 family protein